MKKPAELRAYLTAANPFLRQFPERLSVFVDEGVVVCTGSRSLSHEYRYTLSLIVQEYTGEPAGIVLPILAWLRTAQPELFENPERRANGVKLEIELLNNQAVDVAISLPLTERVVVSTDTDSGKLVARHVGEPPHPDLPENDGQWHVYLDGEQIATVPWAGWNPRV